MTIFFTVSLSIPVFSVSRLVPAWDSPFFGVYAIYYQALTVLQPH
jgi:hypothetical protein